MPLKFDRFLDRALKVRPGEKAKVALMAAYAANAIGAVVVGRTVRDTLFLASGSYTKDDLPLMYILNSVAVALLSWGYSRIADGALRHRLNAYVALGWAVLMTGFFVAATRSASLVAPVLYIAVEAMGALVVIQFWTFAQDVFNAREAKRLFGLIGAGGQVANVIYGFLASGISRAFGAEALLLVCAANLVACAWLASYVGKRYGSATGGDNVTIRPRPRPASRRGGERKGSIRALMTPHLVTIAAIAVLSALAVNLVDYQFKAAAEQNFSDKRELGAFFGRFYGICGAVALAIQMGLTGRVLERFGVLASLLPLPIGLCLGSVAAFISPSGWAASLAKGSDSIFRYTLNDASMQLLYLPVPQHLRGRAKALIDGILRPMAGVAAGLVLVALGHAASLGRLATNTGSDAVTTSIIVLLVGAWVLLLLRGRREYVHSLLDTLQRRRLDLVSQPMNADQATGDALVKILRSDDALTILHALALLPHVRGRDFGPVVAELLDHPVSSVRAAAADHIANHADVRHLAKLRERLNDNDPWCVASAIGAVCALEREKSLATVKPFLTDPSPAIRAAAVVGLVRHAGINGILEAAEELKRLLNATTPVERELASSVLGAIGLPTFYDSLLRYLEDPSPVVRRAALQAAARLRSPELVPHLVRLLARRDTARETAIVLASFGAGIEQALNDALADTTLEHDVLVAIPLVLARIGSKEAAEVLQARLDTLDPLLRASVARALARLLRRRDGIVVRRDVVLRAVRSELDHAEGLVDIQRGLGLASVDRSAPVRGAARSGGARLLLTLALQEERDRSIERSIVLLQLLHPNDGLDVVAENLRSESAARRANAVEVLDNTVREDLKKRLLPLLEDRLVRPLPTTRPKNAWLSELVDGRNAWIAACAAQLAAEDRVDGMVPALGRALMSPVAYVREAAASAVARLSPDEARELLAPLQEDPARSVRRAAEGALVLARLGTA